MSIKSRPLKTRIDGVEQHYNVGRAATSDADARFNRKATSSKNGAMTDVEVIRQADVRARGWTREQVQELLVPHRVEVGSRGPSDSPYGFPLAVVERIERDLGMGEQLAAEVARRAEAEAAAQRAAEMEARPMSDFISHSALLSDGWTDGLIKKHIGDPDRREMSDMNPGYRTWQPTRYYLRERVPALPEKRAKTLNAKAEAEAVAKAATEAARVWLSIPWGAEDARALARSVGSKWNADSKRWGVPGDRVEEVRELITEYEVREKAAEDEREAKRAAERKAEAERAAARVSVSIPFLATEIREEAKALGARWQPASKTWSMDAEPAAAIKAAVASWEAARSAKGEHEFTFSDEWFGRSYSPVYVGGMSLVEHDGAMLVVTDAQDARSQEYSDVTGEIEWMTVTRVQTRAMTDDERAVYDAHLALQEQTRQTHVRASEARERRREAAVSVDRAQAEHATQGVEGVLVDGTKSGTTYDAYTTAYLTDDRIYFCHYNADMAPYDFWSRIPRTPESEADVQAELASQALTTRPASYPFEPVGDDV